jgi:UDP-glucose 4-epimerase
VTSRALVTGGAGFIGSRLTSALLRAGAQVTVLDDLSAGTRDRLGSPHGHLRVVEGDVRDPAALAEALDAVAVVFHLAAIVSIPLSTERPELAHDVNGAGTLRVLEAALRAGVERVVYSSSTAVYGDVDRLPVSEDLPTRPLSPYGESKLAGERCALGFQATHGLPTVALRYFNVFGPGQDPSSDYAAVIPRFIASSLRGQPVTIYGDGEQTRDFVYVDDVVRANLLAADAPVEATGRAVNVATGQGRSVNELAGLVRDLTGSPAEPVRAPERPGEIRHSVADVTLAREVLGFEAVTPFEEGLARTVRSIVRT